MSFWKDAEEAELMIRPFVEASFALQADGRTKADVLLILLNLYCHLVQFGSGTTYSTTITKDMERRWKRQEQHLYLLAMALHPKYRMFVVELLRQSEVSSGNWGTSKNTLSVARLVMAAKFYFAKHRVWSLTTHDPKRCHEDEAYRKEVVKNDARRLGVDMKKWLQGGNLQMV